MIARHNIRLTFRLLVLIGGVGTAIFFGLAGDFTTWADSVGVALLDVPNRQCAGAVVSHADRGSEWRAQDDNDRGIGAQTADSAVAPGHDR